MHVTVGVYANNEMVYNIVLDEDFVNHIAYNFPFRPSRALFVDGICLNQGYLLDTQISEWTQKIQTMEFDISKDTKPYK